MQPPRLVVFISAAAAVANALTGARADGTPLSDPTGAEANKVNLATLTPIDEANPGLAKETDSCPHIDGVRSCHNKNITTVPTGGGPNINSTDDQHGKVVTEMSAGETMVVCGRGLVTAAVIAAVVVF